MATVTTYTAARMKAIEDASVVDGDVVGDNLILTRFDASTINAGNVRGPQGIQGIQGNANIVICTAATRPTGGALYEGLFIYETDTDRVYVYNGTEWVPRGSTVVCTSTTRPVTSVYDGMEIYETDTDRFYVYNGTTWVSITPTRICTSSTRPTGALLFDGLAIYETDTNRPYIYDGSAWEYKGGPVLCTSGARPASPFQGLMIYETDTNRMYAYTGSAWTYVSGGTNPTAAKAYRTSNQNTLVTGWTTLSLTTEDYDYGNNMVNGAYTVPETGMYSIHGQATLFLNNNPQRFILAIMTDGQDVLRSGGGGLIRGGSTGDPFDFIVATEAPCAAGQVLTLRAYNGHPNDIQVIWAGASAKNPSFSVRRV